MIRGTTAWTTRQGAAYLLVEGTSQPPTPKLTPYQQFFANMDPDQRYLWFLGNQFDSLISGPEACSALAVGTLVTAASATPGPEVAAGGALLPWVNYGASVASAGIGVACSYLP